MNKISMKQFLIKGKFTLDLYKELFDLAKKSRFIEFYSALDQGGCEVGHWYITSIGAKKIKSFDWERIYLNIISIREFLKRNKIFVWVITSILCILNLLKYI